MNTDKTQVPIRVYPCSSVAKWFLAGVAGITLYSQTSQWVSLGPDHRLRYKTTERGDRIIDFSFAGYRGGGVRLPSVPVVRTLDPEPGDNTARIQTALDEANGAVLLKPGKYPLAGTLTIKRNGVVLRGSGSDEKGSVIELTGPPHRFLEIRGTGAWEVVGNSTAITDAYIPAGGTSFHVDRAAAFRAGEAVLVRRPVTDQWVHFMGMDTLVRDGKQQTWIRPGTFIRTDRVIRAIAGNRITLDVPLTDSFDAEMLTPPGPSLVKYTFPGRISEVGVEHLAVSAPFQDEPISERQYTAFAMDAVIDAWVFDIVIHETQNSVAIGAAAKRVTLDGVHVRHSRAHSGSAAPADFSLSGTQLFLNRCSPSGEGTWPVVTQSTETGPVVVLNFKSDHRGVAPHQRWATGLLVDGGTFDNTSERTPGIAFSNRKTAGSGHGWDIGWSVAWNVRSPFVFVEQPPGSMNWCIGCVGEPVRGSTGTFDSRGHAVQPESLYLEQLRERLGDRAVTAIGYTVR
jgi:hypothetical protein